MDKLFGFVFVVAFFLWSYLFFTGNAFLISEEKTEMNKSYLIDGYGEIEKGSSEKLICTYFNGRKSYKAVFYYASNNFMGRSSCPTWHE